VWGRANLQAIGPLEGTNFQASVTVDGRVYSGDPRTIPLRDGARIVVQLTGPSGLG
jgi:hypothetical protein